MATSKAAKLRTNNETLKVCVDSSCNLLIKWDAISYARLLGSFFYFLQPLGAGINEMTANEKRANVNMEN